MTVSGDRTVSGDSALLENSFQSFRNQSSDHLLVQKVEDRSQQGYIFTDAHRHERLRISEECSLAITRHHSFFINGLLHICRKSWCMLHDEHNHSICWVNVESLVDKTNLSHTEARRLIRTPSGLARFIKLVDQHLLQKTCDVEEAAIKVPIAPNAYAFLYQRCPSLLSCFAQEEHAQEIKDAIRFVELEGRPFLLHRKRYPFLPRSMLITSGKHLIVLFNRSSKGDEKVAVEECKTKWLGYNITEGREVFYISGYSGCDKGDDCIRQYSRSLSNIHEMITKDVVPGSFLIKKTPEKPEGRCISISEIPGRNSSLHLDEDIE